MKLHCFPQFMGKVLFRSKSSRSRIFVYSCVRSLRLLTIEYSRRRRIIQETSKTTVSSKFVEPLGKY